jgi:ligand-binding sensor domain-containing protein/signal transduction histidine kinase
MILAPRINLLGDFPPPEIINIPTGPNGPEKKPAGFLANLQTFNTEQGLVLSSILCTFKDSAGNLWFGSSGNGVSKYDGKTFTNYNSSSGLIHNLIQQITEDPEGNIWFATYGGVSKFDGITFTNFTMADGLPNNDVLSMHADKEGNVWFGTYDGLSKFDGESFVNYNENQGLPSSFIGAIFEDQKGQIWFATYEGLSLYLPDSAKAGKKPFKNYTTQQGLVDDNTRAIAGDSKGKLWIGTSNGLSRFDPEKEGTAEAFVNFTEADGLLNNKIMCIWIDTDDNIWLGTRTGVCRYKPADDGRMKGSFLNITTGQGLPHNMIEDITGDNSGNLWICTLGGGICKYDSKTVISYKTAQGLSDELIFSTAEDNEGNIWFGTNEGGLIKYDGQSFEIFTTRQGLPANKILALIKSRTGDLWIGTGEGLTKFDGKTFVNYTTQQGLIDNGVVSITEDRSGNIWVGTYEAGLSKFDGTSFTNYTTQQGLVHNTVWDIVEDKQNNLWFGTRGGVSKFDGKTFLNFTRDQGLADNKVSKVFEDRMGNLLIGTWGGGISILRKSTLDNLDDLSAFPGQKKIFETFSTMEGLPNDVVYSILEDSAGDIIIGTSSGITVLKGGLDPDGSHIAKDGAENFNQKTGYPIKDIANNHSMLLDNKGIVWAGTGDKLVRFDLNRVQKNPEPLHMFVSSIKLNNESISWHSLLEARSSDTVQKMKNISVPAYITDELTIFGKKLNIEERDSMVNKFNNVHFDSVSRFFAIPANLALPYTFNSITFEFLGIETSRPDLVTYQYMLKGFDTKWNPISNNNTASYGNLPEGEYTFMVKAKSPDGIWSEPIRYAFEINPPWQRSWPAYLLYGLILVAVIFLVDRIQRQRLISKERQRAVKKELEQAKAIEKAYTELKATQAQLIYSEKMASLGELTAGIAHEIQNPLNFVNNFSEVSIELVDELKQESSVVSRQSSVVSHQSSVVSHQSSMEIIDDIRQNLEKILHHGKRADAIVKGMLQHSRTNSGQKEPTDINALADEYLRLAYHGLRAKDKSFNAMMETDFDGSIGKINVIPQDFSRVILNLINNAFYAVHEKKQQLAIDLSGLSTLTGQMQYQPTVTVSTKRSLSLQGEGRGEVVISIKDNGNGIPDHIIDKIFQPFFTTKPSGQGTGLGLSLSYDIIKAHGGELKVRTKEGEGTSFDIMLPLK